MWQLSLEYVAEGVEQSQMAVRLENSGEFVRGKSSFFILHPSSFILRARSSADGR